MTSPEPFAVLDALLASGQVPNRGPEPKEFLTPEQISLINTVTKLGGTLPLLQAAIATCGRDAMIEGMTPTRWLALAEILDKPAGFLVEAARHCRDQALGRTMQESDD